MSTGTLDHETLQAVGVLARAVEQARVPGVLEFRLLSNALNRTIQSRGERELHEAARVYETLDRDFRARIVEHANAMARAEVAAARLRDAPTMVPPRPVTPPAESARSATGFLAALNGARGQRPRKEPPPDSRSAAKGRLLAAVEERRNAAYDLADDLADITLRAGVPLPRSV